MEKSLAQDATELSSENVPVSEQTNSQTSTDSQTSSQEAIRASPTLPLVMQQTRDSRRSQVSSSELLMSFARGLCYVRTQSQNSTQMGLGIDFEEFSNPLATLLSPSESEPVVLALTSDGKECSCSPNFRSPNARDHKGMSAKSWRERAKGDKTPTLPDQIGGTPHPEFVEQLMGFPIGWTDLEV